MTIARLNPGIPSSLRRFTGNEETVRVADACTVAQAVQRLVEQHQGEIRIRVAAAGINFADVLARYPEGNRYGVPVGYSGHERGLQISLAAVALGAVAVERHITLDRTMWGSDQASSLEPKGLEALVRDIRILEDAMGDGVKQVFPGELAPLSRLRRVDA